ncbi:MAG: hypothetical protein ABH843_05460 [Candidatus Omnitrophota bacterium]
MLLLVVFVVGCEVLLRMFMPDLGADLFKNKSDWQEPVYIFNEEFGYEPIPSAFYERKDKSGVSVMEQVNSEGFRGPEYLIQKPENTLRILALGDSVVEDTIATYNNTWEKILESNLCIQAHEPEPNKSCEVINAGVRGYTCRQILSRV